MAALAFAAARRGTESAGMAEGVMAAIPQVAVDEPRFYREASVTALPQRSRIFDIPIELAHPRYYNIAWMTLIDEVLGTHGAFADVWSAHRRDPDTTKSATLADL